MSDISNLWSSWIQPSAGVPTLQWSLILACAAVVGQFLQRYLRLPKIVGYSVVGAVAGLGGLVESSWPLEGTPLFLLELGLSVVLFEAGLRVPLRWFRYHPMLLVQSFLVSGLSYLAVLCLLAHWGLPRHVAHMLALIAMASSPAMLAQVVADTYCAGPVTDRALLLSTLGCFYALTLGGTQAAMAQHPGVNWMEPLKQVATMLSLSVLIGALVAQALRSALHFMSPTSDNTAILLLALIAAGTAVATTLGGAAPLAALLGGLLFKQMHPRPWTWPPQLGMARSLLGMMMFVLVSAVAARAPFNREYAALVGGLIGARWAGQLMAMVATQWRSGLRWVQVAALVPTLSALSAVALLIASQLAAALPQEAQILSGVALPAILVTELLGAVLSTLALRLSGERTQKEPILRHSTEQRGSK